MTDVDFSPKPYRVERRLHIGQPWLLVCEAGSHEEALAAMRKTVEDYGGYGRVVVQHVIERFDAGMRSRRTAKTRRVAASRAGKMP